MTLGRNRYDRIGILAATTDGDEPHLLLAPIQGLHEWIETPPQIPVRVTGVILGLMKILTRLRGRVRIVAVKIGAPPNPVPLSEWPLQRRVTWCPV